MRLIQTFERGQVARDAFVLPFGDRIEQGLVGIDLLFYGQQSCCGPERDIPHCFEDNRRVEAGWTASRYGHTGHRRPDMREVEVVKDTLRNRG